MKIVETYKADIYVGLQPGYEFGDGDAEESYFIEEVEDICQNYVDRVKLGVTVTPTTFVYVDGSEDGAIVGLINYPRFPSTPEKIKETAIDLAKILKEELGQYRVSIVCTDETIMLE